MMFLCDFFLFAGKIETIHAVALHHRAVGDVLRGEKNVAASLELNSTMR